MKIDTCPIKDLLVIRPNIYSDERGYFFENYNQKIFSELSGLSSIDFVQDNESLSLKGTLRGLHFQVGAMAQSKLVRVIYGEVLDVAVDIRKESSTYGKHYSLLLSGENKTQLFIPKGFAHGFFVLSDKAIFAYKVDNYYSSEHERGIRYNDIDLNIDWGDIDKIKIVSDKDKLLPRFSELSKKELKFI